MGKAGNALLDVGKEEGLTRAVSLDEGGELEVGEEGRPGELRVASQVA